MTPFVSMSRYPAIVFRVIAFQHAGDVFVASSSQPPLHIFISHSQVDNEFGIKLVNDLHQALGERGTIWYDAHGGLHGGDTWWPKIAAEVKASNVFIVILSPQAVASQWVNDEINLAWLQRNKTGMLIIPISYRKCNIPDFLYLVQIISFLSPKPYREALDELLNALTLTSPPIPRPVKPHPLLFPVRVATSAMKRASRISKEKIIQFVAILIITACLVFSGILVDRSVVASRDATASQNVMATSIATHYPFSNHEVLHDPLTSTNQQVRWQWDTKNCAFTNQGYVSEAIGTPYSLCVASKTNFTNFSYEVTMTFTEGENDCGDLVFRANATQTGYLAGLCENGYYYLDAYGSKSDSKFLINSTPSGFNVGLNYPVSFGIVARGTNIGLYINGTFIASSSNKSFGHGQIGVGANDIIGPTQVIFSNAQVWTLS
jgi:hypothetical protein